MRENERFDQSEKKDCCVAELVMRTCGTNDAS